MKYAVGIDLGATNLRAGLVNEDGRVVYSERRPTEGKRGGEHVLANLIGLADHCIQEGPVQPGDVVGVGIGSPGVIDAKNGVVLSASSNIVGWWGTRVKENVEGELGLPTFVDNDVNVIAIGEHAFGAAKGYNDFVCMALGSGVGGCVFLDGAIRRGSRGAAGELGHLTVDVNGRLCNCGRVGCLEVYTSAWAIAERARTRIAAGAESLIAELAEGDLERIESMHVFGAAKEGDLLALVIVGEVARLLAAALADLANLVDPALFVITGGVAQAGEDLRGRVEQELSVTATVGSEPPPPVVLGTLGGDAGMMGGAALALSGTTF